MSESVSDVIAARARAETTLVSPLGWSVAAHVCLIAVVWLMPQRSANAPPRTVMTISLGGAAGPRTGGQTQLGGRAVPPTPVAPAKPTPLPPAPTPARPLATLPREKPAPARSARTAPTPAAPSPEAPREGSTRVETGARGQGFGLASGGGGGGAVQLDVANFCCPEYIEQMRLIIERSWDRNQGVRGTTSMKFTILRDGTVEMVAVDMSSGFYALDNAATRALVRTQRLPALPTAFTNPSLTVRMRFVY
jgi:TonB family protein